VPTSVTRKPSQRQVSAQQPCAYEDLFLPSQRCLTPLAKERLSISTQSIHRWKIHLSWLQFRPSQNGPGLFSFI